MSDRRLRIASWPARRNRADNPYNALLSDALEQAGASVDELEPTTRPGHHDVWLVHWPDDPLHDPHRVRGVARTTAFVIAIARARRRGTRLVWVVHNLVPHDPALGAFGRWYLRRFVARVDAVVHLSEAGRRIAEAEVPRLVHVPSVVVPHGHYRGAYGGERSKADARRVTGTPEHAVVLTFVGQVRAYKGVPELARAFTDVTRRDAHLVIAGEARDATEVARLGDAARRDPRLVLALERHTPEALGALVQASDAVVLPYRSVLNSGTAILALSYGRPVVVPDTPVFAELASIVGSEWVRALPMPPTGASLSDLIDDLASRPPDGAPDLARLDWRPIADATMRFLAQLERS